MSSGAESVGASGASVDWAEDFSYEFLAGLYRKLIDRFEPRVISQATEVVERPIVLVRHDVDLSVRLAVDLARMEAELGLRATYHVMVDCPFYRVEDPEVIEGLSLIANLGHEVGLHYDPDNPRATAGSIEDDIELCCERVEVAAGGPVRSLSFHRPAPEYLGGSLHVAGRVNAYAAPFFQWYLSDSRARWREGNPLDSIAHPRSEILQMLVHPIWWGPGKVPPGERLGNFVRSIAAARDLELEDATEAVLGHIGFPHDQLILGDAAQ